MHDRRKKISHDMMKHVDITFRLNEHTYMADYIYFGTVASNIACIETEEFSSSKKRVRRQ